MAKENVDDTGDDNEQLEDNAEGVESTEELATDDDDDSWQDEDEDEEEDEASRAEVDNAAPKYSYVLLAVIIGGIFFSLLPVWFQAPNGYKLLKSTFSEKDAPASSAASGKSCVLENEVLFTKNDLARYTDKPKILLGFLGVVYDVTGGSYYQPDGSYHFFAGKDGTRGFLTGEFTAEELVDDISDLDPSYFSGIDTWLSLYDEKYVRVGRLVGAYYDENGCETPKLALVLKKIKQAQNKEAEDKQEQQKYPPCNTEWDATNKRGRAWCTTLSGGINRSWAGRPRLFYVLANKSWRCACVQEDAEVSSEDWCDKPPKAEEAVDGQPKSAGVKYAPDEAGHTANCLWKHYTDCDDQASECLFRD